EEQAAYQQKVKQIDAEIKDLKKRMAEAVDLEQRLAEAEDRKPQPLPTLFSVIDDPQRATPVYVLARGDYRNQGPQVHARPLGVLVGNAVREVPDDEPRPRTKLADWILSPSNPLTARVIVNRIWSGHFGRGIVATPNDFGRMGARPSNPELLDYLAARFVESG